VSQPFRPTNGEACLNSVSIAWSSAIITQSPDLNDEDRNGRDIVARKSRSARSTGSSHTTAIRFGSPSFGA